MIVCICNNVSDRDIRKAVAAGMSTMRELRQNLGVATCCGKCDSCARQVLRECLAHAQPSVAPIGLQPEPIPA
jgi:bacterioferritin-associated ferredoxin